MIRKNLSFIRYRSGRFCNPVQQLFHWFFLPGKCCFFLRIKYNSLAPIYPILNFNEILCLESIKKKRGYYCRIPAVFVCQPSSVFFYCFSRTANTAIRNSTTAPEFPQSVTDSQPILLRTPRMDFHSSSFPPV